MYRSDKFVSSRFLIYLPILVWAALELRSRGRILQVGAAAELGQLTLVAVEDFLRTGEAALPTRALGEGPAVRTTTELAGLASLVLLASGLLPSPRRHRLTVIAAAKQCVRTNRLTAFECRSTRHSVAIPVKTS